MNVKLLKEVEERNLLTFFDLNRLGGLMFTPLGKGDSRLTVSSLARGAVLSPFNG